MSDKQLSCLFEWHKMHKMGLLIEPFKPYHRYHKSMVGRTRLDNQEILLKLKHSANKQRKRWVGFPRNIHLH